MWLDMLPGPEWQEDLAEDCTIFRTLRQCIFAFCHRWHGKFISKTEFYSPEVFHFLQVYSSNCTVSPVVGGADNDQISLGHESTQKPGSALGITCFSGPSQTLLYPSFSPSWPNRPGQSARLLLDAGLKMLVSHPNRLKLGFKTTWEKERWGGKSLMRAEILQR